MMHNLDKRIERVCLNQTKNIPWSAGGLNVEHMKQLGYTGKNRNEIQQNMCFEDFFYFFDGSGVFQSMRGSVQCNWTIQICHRVCKSHSKRHDVRASVFALIRNHSCCCFKGAPPLAIIPGRFPEFF